MAIDTNKTEASKFMKPAESSIPAFDKYLVPTCDDYGHEIVDNPVTKKTTKPNEES